MYKQQSDYPLALTVREIAEILRIGLSKAYLLVKQPGFPSVLVGSRIVIPRDSFFNWLMDSAGNNSHENY